jgi:hypothetical protein
MYSQKEKLTIKSANIECFLRILIARIQPKLKKKTVNFLYMVQEGQPNIYRRMFLK